MIITILVINVSFLDIDECDKVNGPFGRCGGNSVCTNSPGGYACQCKPGFTGNAFKQCTGMTIKLKSVGGLRVNRLKTVFQIDLQTSTSAPIRIVAERMLCAKTLRDRSVARVPEALCRIRIRLPSARN